METFDFCPRINPTGQTTFRTRVAQFGDGYAQRVGDGINTRKESWPLEFIGNEEYIAPIKSFLDSHAGHMPFMWTPPLGEQGEYVAPDGYALTAMGGDAYTLTVTLVENNPLWQ